MRIMFVSDVHGEFLSYFNLINFTADIDKSYQLGDMGIGFPDTPRDYNNIFPIKNKHKFIRGNHDNPEVCRLHEHYLGNYGITSEGIFYVSGAFSVDKQWRTPYVDWWPNEELSTIELYKAIDLYEKEKPEIVMSHCPPLELIPLTSTFDLVIESSTSKSFSEMLKIHQPKKWIFGHMHKNLKTVINNTEFICLNIMEYYILEM